MHGEAGIIVSHDSALEFWRLARSAGTGGGTEDLEPSGRVFGASSLSATDLAARALSVCGLSAPLHVLSVGGAGRIGSPIAKSHRCKVAPAPASLFLVERGIRVCRMPLAMVQLASSRDEIELAQIAYEMTGTYGIDPRTGETVDAAALLEMQELRSQAMFARATGAPGASRVCKALEQVVPNSNSIKESDVALFFMRSRARGGANLPGFEMNKTIELPAELQRIVGQATITPDFYWSAARLILEYESDEYHSTPEAMQRDERRRRAFEAAGYMQRRLTNDILKSDTQLNIFIGELARRLDPYRAPASDTMLAQRRALRERLFGPQAQDEALLDLRAPYEGVVL